MKCLISVMLRLNQFLIYILNYKVVWVIHTYFPILIWRLVHRSPPVLKINKRVESLLYTQPFMVREGLEFKSFIILILVSSAVSIISFCTFLTFLVVKLLALFLISFFKHLLYLLTILIRDAIIWWQLESLDFLLLVRGMFWLTGTLWIILFKNLLHNVILRWNTRLENVCWKFLCLDLYLFQVENFSWTI
jgi:hypothetical protein